MDSLDASQFSRYFINVPQGADYLEAELEVFPNTGEAMKAVLASIS